MSPVYEYNCPNCEVDMELVRPMAEYNTPQTCPKCGKQLIKLFTYASQIVMKDKDNFYAAGVDKPIWNKKRGNIAVPNKGKCWATASEQKAGGIKVYGGTKK